MKTQLRHRLTMLTLFSCLLPAAVQAQFTFTTNNGAITITGYTGPGGAVVIPATTNGYPVTSIGNGAFYTNASMTSVSIGTNVTSIGEEAFYGCDFLPGASIPNSVTNIGVAAFEYCSSLTNLSIGTNVTSIGGQAFYDCFSLTTVTIPNGVTSIGDYAFEYCSSLKSAYFQGNAPPNDGTVFLNDGGAMTVYYQSGTMGWGSTFGGVPAVGIAPNGSLQVTIIPAGAVSAGAYWQVDGGANQNSGATVANLSVGTHTVSFTTVSGWATPANQTVSVSDNLTSTASGTYVQSSPFTCTINNNNTLSVVAYTGTGGTVTIPATIGGLPVTSIGTNVFYHNTSVTNVSIGTNTTSIGAAVFYDCFYMTSMSIPNSVTNIGDEAFYNCENLTSVSIPTNLTRIGNYAFYGCVDMPNQAIPAPVTSIGYAAFAFCTGLNSVTIPAGVTNIGDYAFEYDDNLRPIYFLGNAPPDDGTVFYQVNINNVTVVYYLYGTTGWGPTFSGVPTSEILPTSSLQVTINPAGAVSAGAQWQVDGGPAQNSGATVVNLSVGNHTVTFTTSGGWATPTNEIISTSNNLTTTASGTYVQSSPFTCVINTNNTLTIVGYIGAGGTVAIPATIGGLPVTSIGTYAFFDSTSVSSLTIGANITGIGYAAFDYCSGLASVTIPGSVTNIGDYAFEYCSSLASTHFEGNAPPDDGTVFYADDGITTVYYLPGTTGWGSTFGGVPAVLLNPAGPALGIALASSQRTMTKASGNFVLSSSPGVGTAPESVAVMTNFNGQGTMALISANYGAKTLTILTNNGSGIFGSNATYTTLAGPVCLAVADVNGDGKPDLIYASPDNGTLTVLTNNGSGIFGSNAVYSVPGQPYNFQAADVNGDGNVDLVVADYSASEMTVLTNTGTGAFVSSGNFNCSGQYPRWIAVADYNGDGRPDIAVADYYIPHSLAILSNSGNGKFVYASSVVVGGYAFGVVAADVNGDGKPDLISSAGTGGNVLSVSTNNGNGTFTSAANYTVGPSPSCVVAADVNGDGKPDLICVNSDSTLTVLTNSGSGTFVLDETIPAVGAGTSSALVADVNGDGAPDLVTANTGTNTLTVLTNSATVLTTTVRGAVISWPSPSTGFLLQQNSNLATTNWTNSNFPVNDNGTTRWVTNSSAAGSLFYRLNHP